MAKLELVVAPPWVLLAIPSSPFGVPAGVEWFSTVFPLQQVFATAVEAAAEAAAALLLALADAPADGSLAAPPDDVDATAVEMGRSKALDFRFFGSLSLRKDLGCSGAALQMLAHINYDFLLSFKDRIG